VAKRKKGEKTSARNPEERHHLEDPGVDAVKEKKILVTWEVIVNTTAIV
jgi:hypothetical protein